MNNFAKLKVTDRQAVFEGTAAQLNIQPHVVEKDFWVCWTLQELFQLPTIGAHLIFKGGTSLSKVFNIIERFSEDIDISIDRSFLGFGGENDPEAAKSNKEKQRRIEDLKSACQKKISGELQPALDALIKAKLGVGEKWAVRNDENDPDQQTLLFEYPTAFPSGTTDYIRRAVKIEMGARSDHWPAETATVTPFVAEKFPEAFKNPHGAVKVLSAERTFWEKATILHAEFHRQTEKQMPERFSRHYYDFHKLVEKGIAAKAIQKPELLERVAQHKLLFFKSSWAKYETAVKGSLRLYPQENRISAIREDYQKMHEMFFNEPPAFDDILANILAWEKKFNGELPQLPKPFAH